MYAYIYTYIHTCRARNPAQISRHPPGQWSKGFFHPHNPSGGFGKGRPELCRHEGFLKRPHKWHDQESEYCVEIAPRSDGGLDPERSPADVVKDQNSHGDDSEFLGRRYRGGEATLDRLFILAGGCCTIFRFRRRSFFCIVVVSAIIGWIHTAAAKF